MTTSAPSWRMPPEWAKHRATILSWPHNRDTWPHDLDAVEAVWVEMALALLPGEEVWVNAGTEDLRRRVLGKFGNEPPKGLRVLPVSTNDSWVRDHGPIFVKRGAEVAVTDWGYNAWGGKYPPFEEDDQVPGRVAALMGYEVIEGGMILEGGSIEVDGDGVLLVTETCLLTPTRNPGMNKTQIEQRLKEVLGVVAVLWLPGADVSGDDTDGHVDNLARFTPDGSLLVARERDRGDENYAALEENFQAALGLKNPLSDKPYEVIEVPMPPVQEQHGLRLPASYMNYYIANGVVLLPVYDGPQDETVARLLKSKFPDHRICPINCRAMIWGQGAIHCSTQQVPW